MWSTVAHGYLMMLINFLVCFCNRVYFLNGTIPNYQKKTKRKQCQISSTFKHVFSYFNHINHLHIFSLFFLP
ncbi:hypothetical protein EB241_19545 [Erwinia psidii]|uniref:Uncharacterized protein n=1 Tax=Erwinia psidii TaxID=69224 RepID=A0A3N6RUG9_9GAMM|nr:hypothetical protein EB241_19545 [Erwinia psidii]